jgi:hypothetical protein
MRSRGSLAGTALFAPPEAVTGVIVQRDGQDQQLLQSVAHLFSRSGSAPVEQDDIVIAEGVLGADIGG